MRSESNADSHDRDSLSIPVLMRNILMFRDTLSTATFARLLQRMKLLKKGLAQGRRFVRRRVTCGACGLALGVA